MREIKFRAWDKKASKMIYDIQREYDMSVYGEDAFGVYLNQDCGYGRNGKEHYEVMQYTGLHDKNGKEIYEGDIVRVYEYLNGKIWHSQIHDTYVIFHAGRFKLEDEWCHQNLASNEIEVIGNIYETKLDE